MESINRDLKKFNHLQSLGPEHARDFIVKKYEGESPRALHAIANMHTQMSQNHFKYSLLLFLLNLFSISCVVGFSVAFSEKLNLIVVPHTLVIFSALFYALTLYQTYSCYKLYSVHSKYSSVLLSAISYIRAKAPSGVIS